MTHTADINTAIENLEDDIDDLEEEMRDVARRAEEEELTPDLRNQFQKKKQMKEEISRQLGIFRQCAEDWDGSKFEFQSFLTVGETLEMRDELSQDSDIQKSRNPERDFGGRIRGVQFARMVESTPSGAPENPNDLPEDVGNWLQNKIQSVVVPDDVDEGNETIEEYMEDV